MLFGEEHVRRYQETDGAEGHDWEGTHTLLLTTTGRRTGEPRTTPLIYGEHDGDYLIVGSKGGADAPPAWLLNLETKPEVKVQVLADRFTAHARVATAEEKSRMWSTMVGEWPAYDSYQQKTTRDIPVIVLERK